MATPINAKYADLPLTEQAVAYKVDGELHLAASLAAHRALEHSGVLSPMLQKRYKLWGDEIEAILKQLRECM